jgi:hypothetical protein
MIFHFPLFICHLVIVERTALKLRGFGQVRESQGKEGWLAPASSVGPSDFQGILQGTEFLRH